MATQQEILEFVLKASGQEEVDKIAAAMRSAGAAGKEAEPEIQGLTSELGALLDQRSGIDNLIKLKATFADLQTQVGAAKTKVDGHAEPAY